MKKRFFYILLLFIISFGLFGCNGLTTTFATTSESTIITTQINNQIHEIYLLAVGAEQTDLTYAEWLESIKGDQGLPGADGKEVLLRVYDGMIQWQHVGESTWNDLIALSELIGPEGVAGVDARDIILQVASGNIQWQYSGAETWTNLISIDVLSGVSGADGSEVVFQIGSGFIQWKYVDEEVWNDLIELSSLAGTDAREIIFDVFENYIVFKYVGDTTWTNLVSLDTISGEPGKGILSTGINESGELIVTYTDLTFDNLGKILEIYIVNFKDINGYLIDSQVILQGMSATAPSVPVIEGYDFISWSADFSVVTGNLSVQATYLIETNTVNFYDYEGALIKTETVDYNQDATPPAVAERNYFVFTGWDNDYSQVTGDLDIHPIWQARTYSGEEIFQLANPATVEIRIYGQWGDDIKLGSGFFISEDGIVVTNHHVIEGGYSATVVTFDDQEYEVISVLGYNETLDLAILKIEAVTPSLRISERVNNTGATIFTLGSPLGLAGSFSDGVISTASRKYGGIDYIQITAPLSHGNSGGPLLNIYGEVIGVNTATFVDGQNLNLAVNINQLASVDTDTPTTLEDMYQEYWGYDYYPWDNEIPESEPNNSLVDADVIGENGLTINGELSDISDSDYFKFELDASALVTLMLFADNDNELLEIKMTLQDNLGVEIATATIEDFDAYYALYIQEDLELVATETYYAVISLVAGSELTSITYDLFYHAS